MPKHLYVQSYNDRGDPGVYCARFCMSNNPNLFQLEPVPVRIPVPAVHRGWTNLLLPPLHRLTYPSPGEALSETPVLTCSSPCDHMSGSSRVYEHHMEQWQITRHRPSGHRSLY